MTALELTIAPATEVSRRLSSAAVDVTDTPPIWSVVALT